MIRVRDMETGEHKDVPTFPREKPDRPLPTSANPRDQTALRPQRSRILAFPFRKFLRYEPSGSWRGTGTTRRRGVSSSVTSLPLPNR